jgi:hypothetical protein
MMMIIYALSLSCLKCHSTKAAIRKKVCVHGLVKFGPFYKSRSFVHHRCGQVNAHSAQTLSALLIPTSMRRMSIIGVVVYTSTIMYGAL